MNAVAKATPNTNRFVDNGNGTVTDTLAEATP